MRLAIAILTALTTAAVANAQSRGFTGPFTGYEAETLSDLWPQIRQAQHSEDIKPPVYLPPKPARRLPHRLNTQTYSIAKAHVADVIRKVENGVDEFRNYLERRGENARDRESSSSSSGTRARRGDAATREARRAQASDTKDELKDELDELNRSTNRLRRKFDPSDNWIETKVQAERVIDDGRKINQRVTRGNYGSEVARLWGVLRTQLNELARVYSITPLGV